MKALIMAALGVLGLQMSIAARADLPVNPELLAMHDAMFAKCNELQPQFSHQFTELRHARFAEVSDERLKSWIALPQYESAYRSTLAALERATRDQLMASCSALAKAKASEIINP